ncbi:formimidoylglutamase [Marinirhabdus gelatinilytica]|uniref:Formiminoglutamase n=1 Tax=Marinirhabdus gelatinilytica TaxID=1703343 RepID=A0A370QFM4_9FLAO|nr:formimidoylglutamase [Marinirhabdus gelatinilytica]RDK87099.1 formiminoglutamase [Marinirhabdus gelatinilytica]
MLKIYTKEDLLSYTNARRGELKFGQVTLTVSSLEDLKDAPQKYILLGIPEDIGVRANHGKPGASKAWEALLSALCNIQQTQYCQANSCIVLGELDCTQQMQQAAALDTSETHYVEKLGELVSQIDHLLAEIIETIVSFGKVPIVVGGGHNNSFGNLKGASKALGIPINCINFDAHTDFRALEHRHSGNGFSYAAQEGFLERYFIFGLHRNYTSQVQLDRMAKVAEKVRFSFFEDISVTQKKSFAEAMQEAEGFCCTASFGLEIDMDAIAGMGSSAIGPSGFSVEDCRRFVRYFSEKKHCSYIHICEGAPNRELFAGQVGKTIAYLVSDIIAH